METITINVKRIQRMHMYTMTLQHEMEVSGMSKLCPLYYESVCDLHKKTEDMLKQNFQSLSLSEPPEATKSFFGMPLFA